jgi:hypothetical protein
MSKHGQIKLICLFCWLSLAEPSAHNLPKLAFEHIKAIASSLAFSLEKFLFPVPYQYVCCIAYLADCHLLDLSSSGGCGFRLETLWRGDDTFASRHHLGDGCECERRTSTGPICELLPAIIVD